MPGPVRLPRLSDGLRPSNAAAARCRRPRGNRTARCAPPSAWPTSRRGRARPSASRRNSRPRRCPSNRPGGSCCTRSRAGPGRAGSRRWRTDWRSPPRPTAKAAEPGPPYNQRWEVGGRREGDGGVRSSEEAGVEKFLAELRAELVTRTYRPLRNRRVEIPKTGGKVRVLGIPAIRDRVVQGALKLILEPIFEADFHEGAFGYRPKRTAQQAV